MKNLVIRNCSALREKLNRKEIALLKRGNRMLMDGML
jgi:hypothetical protein